MQFALSPVLQFNRLSCSADDAGRLPPKRTLRRGYATHASPSLGGPWFASSHLFLVAEAVSDSGANGIPIVLAAPAARYAGIATTVVPSMQLD